MKEHSTKDQPIQPQTTRLDVLLKEHEIIDINLHQLWKKNDQSLVLLATALFFLISQIKNIPGWMFLVIPFGFMTWGAIFLLSFWDAVMVSKYHTEIQNEIDREIGKPTLSVRHELEDVYWNPTATKIKLGKKNPRLYSQVLGSIFLIFFYFFFVSYGLVWLYQLLNNLLLTLIAACLYIIALPVILYILHSSFLRFISQHINSTKPFEAVDISKDLIKKKEKG
jgi:hypothetical protein